MKIERTERKYTTVVIVLCISWRSSRHRDREIKSSPDKSWRRSQQDAGGKRCSSAMVWRWSNWFFASSWTRHRISKTGGNGRVICTIRERGSPGVIADYPFDRYGVIAWRAACHVIMSISKIQCERTRLRLNYRARNCAISRVTYNDSGKR